MLVVGVALTESSLKAVIRNSLLVLGLVLCVFGRGELAVPLIASAVI